VTIRETIEKLDALAAEPRETPTEALDDLGEAEYLCLTCSPALSPAAVEQLMGRFCRKADIQ
jgi:hypothetical protein